MRTGHRLVCLMYHRVVDEATWEALAGTERIFAIPERRLDEQLAYTFTMRMSPTAVQLRLLARPESPLRYLLVRRST